MSCDHHSCLSDIATGDGHREDSLYFHGWKAYRDDPFHLTKNPKGVIQMGLAENPLCFDLIKRWVLRNPGASICTPEGVEEFMATAIFQDYHGLPEFRNGVANFMGKVRGNKVKFNPDRIVMSGGATGAHETIAFCLANRGDAFLVPTPYYPGFDRDLRWRTEVQFVPVVCDSSNDFKLSLPALETAYEEAKASKINVKGVLITNPSNPLGTTLDSDTLRGLLAFSTDKNIHLVCDEIYAATVFSGPAFTSIAEIVEEQPQCNRDLVHIVYSLSKDMGLPGFRVGILYSYNDAVVSCARKMSSFGLVSTQTQRLLATMLSDEDFVDEFVGESARRLAARHAAFVRGLGDLGIKCLDSNAGLFFWMDLRGLLEEATVEAETKLWLVILREVKLNVSPGTSFHCPEPGWFRVCFANMDEETVRVALWRIRKFVIGDRETKAPSNKRCGANRLQLSLSFRRLEDTAMSPHSPLLPQSPLVRMFGQGLD